jgi:hypothetical protein
MKVRWNLHSDSSQKSHQDRHQDYRLFVLSIGAEFQAAHSFLLLVSTSYTISQSSMCPLSVSSILGFTLVLSCCFAALSISSSVYQVLAILKQVSSHKEEEAILMCSRALTSIQALSANRWLLESQYVLPLATSTLLSFLRYVSLLCYAVKLD